MLSCDHLTFKSTSSTHAAEVGYNRPTLKQRAAAATLQKLSKNNKNTSIEFESTFPTPLVLPNDDLSLDPSYPPQSLRSWTNLTDRNEVTRQENVVYVVAPPDVDPEVEFIHSWTHARGHGEELPVTTPHIQDVMEYLTAFYDGLPVKKLPLPALHFSGWCGYHTKAMKRSPTPRYIGLNTSTECIRIRTRASVDGIFARQLNLDDLLDAAISILPKDAYALLLLVNHDLFESADDEFVCGRAYGGSRVAVVSTARYNPVLDHMQNVERYHAWPASHCEAYIKACCLDPLELPSRPNKRARTVPNSPSTLSKSRSPLQAAISACRALPSLEHAPTSATLSGLWLGRVCKTASHELGHCFGIDHCVYYACSMQGSSTLTEDARQPPYICPIDLSKLLKATGATATQRYQALLSFCERHPDIHLFSAFAAWIRGRLAEMDAMVTT